MGIVSRVVPDEDVTEEAIAAAATANAIATFARRDVSLPRLHTDFIGRSAERAANPHREEDNAQPLW